jgi:hypothetical protein
MQYIDTVVSKANLQFKPAPLYTAPVNGTGWQVTGVIWHKVAHGVTHVTPYWLKRDVVDILQFLNGLIWCDLVFLIAFIDYDLNKDNNIGGSTLVPDTEKSLSFWDELSLWCYQRLRYFCISIIKFIHYKWFYTWSPGSGLTKPKPGPTHHYALHGISIIYWSLSNLAGPSVQVGIGDVI